MDCTYCAVSKRTAELTFVLIIGSLIPRPASMHTLCILGWRKYLDNNSANREKIEFSTPFELYGFEMMPFGLHSASVMLIMFQRMINWILAILCSGVYI